MVRSWPWGLDLPFTEGVGSAYASSPYIDNLSTNLVFGVTTVQPTTFTFKRLSNLYLLHAWAYYHLSVQDPPTQSIPRMLL
jgi:hypothetical protein